MINDDNDIEHLSVMNFEPNKLQFKINDLLAWRETNSDSDFQIGTFIKVKDGNERSIVAQIQSYQTIEAQPDENNKNDAIIVAARPIGVLYSENGETFFSSGIKNISIPPQGIELTSTKDLKSMLSKEDSDDSFSFGHYGLNPEIAINVDGNRFFSHHVAIVGSTGSGKSGTVAKILQNVIKHRSQALNNDSILNNSHIIIFDVHGEYGHAFPKSRILTTDKNFTDSSQELWIPYWLLTSEELESIFIENNEINAYNQIAQFKAAVIQNKIKWNPSIKNVDYDMPIYFSINEVLEFIKNKNSETHYTKEEKIYYATRDEDPREYQPEDSTYLFEAHSFYSTSGNSKNPNLKAKVDAKLNGFYGEFPRFITRFQTKLNDSRLHFLLKEPDNPEEYLNHPEKTFSSLVPMIFGNAYDEKNKHQESNITIIDLSALPFEIVSIIVSVISRMAFEISFYQTRIWGKNKTPLMMVYEEAHRYVPKNQLSKYRDTRVAVERIAKEGRKYGISEMIVTQRPSEVSPTVLSQCNNFVVMKLTNQDDQNLIKSILPDTDNYFTSALSSLGRQEALLVGDAMVNTSIIKVDNADPLPQSLDVDVYNEWSKKWQQMILDQVINKMIN